MKKELKFETLFSDLSINGYVEMSINLDFQNHIILDNCDTWSKTIHKVIDESKDELCCYLKEKQRIDNLAEKRVDYRLDRPVNIYEKPWNETLEIIEYELKDTNFIGFHCSKLLDFEMADILTNGLRPLDSEFSNSRVQKAHEDGYIGEELKNQLLNKSVISAKNRNGQICFFHAISTLKDKNGLSRLFKSWGGEAMYLNFEQNTELQKIGTPCIVVASLKRENLSPFVELPEIMICIRLGKKYYPKDFNTNFKTQSSVDVLRIIKRDEKLFEELTQINEWNLT